MTQSEIICVGCPLGCRVILTVGPDSRIESMVGNRCREGEKYVATEFQNPARVFTATVLTEGGDRRLLPVKTDRPVPKSRLKELSRAVARMRIKPTVRMGQKIVHDILGTGANLVSTGTLSAGKSAN
jgi:CxxC motif-containing protein